MTIFRPAHEADLKQMYEVWYQTEVFDSPDPSAPGTPPSYLWHVLLTATVEIIFAQRTYTRT